MVFMSMLYVDKATTVIFNEPGMENPELANRYSPENTMGQFDNSN